VLSAGRQRQRRSGGQRLGLFVHCRTDEAKNVGIRVLLKIISMEKRIDQLLIKFRGRCFSARN